MPGPALATMIASQARFRVSRAVFVFVPRRPGTASPVRLKPWTIDGAVVPRVFCSSQAVAG